MHVSMTTGALGSGAAARDALIGWR